MFSLLGLSDNKEKIEARVAPSMGVLPISKTDFPVPISTGRVKVGEDRSSSPTFFPEVSGGSVNSSSPSLPGRQKLSEDLPSSDFVPTFGTGRRKPRGTFSQNRSVDFEREESFKTHPASNYQSLLSCNVV